MCSTEQRIVAIGRAIDELAAHTQHTAGTATRPAATISVGSDPGNETGPAGADDASQVLSRLALLWSQLAELNPEVARRLPHYLA
jgi:hypothetical protein